MGGVVCNCWVPLPVGAGEVTPPLAEAIIPLLPLLTPNNQRIQTNKATVLLLLLAAALLQQKYIVFAMRSWAC